MSQFRKPIIERQGGPLGIVSSIVSNPGTIYAVSAVAGLGASPNLAAVREAIINLVGKLFLNL